MGLPDVSALGEPTEWAVLVADGELDAMRSVGVLSVPDPDGRTDLTEVAVREEGPFLDLRVSSRDGPQPAEPVTPEGAATFTLHFVVVRGKAKVEGTFTLTVEPEGLVRIQGVGAGTRNPIYALPQDMHPYAFLLRIGKGDLFADGRLDLGDEIRDAWAELRTVATDPVAGMPSSTVDRAPDAGSGGAYDVRSDAGEAAPRPAWEAKEGPDFAAGPDAAYDREDRLFVSYLVYNNQRGVATGAYLAEVTPGGLHPLRVGDVTYPESLHEEGRTRTTLAIGDDDVLHMVYTRNPGASGAERMMYVTARAGPRGLEPAGPAEEIPDAVTGGAVKGSWSGVPDVASGHGRVLVCVAADGGSSVRVLERGAQGAWSLLQTLDGARFCRLAIDRSGRYHLAYFHPTDSSREVAEGSLMYTHEGRSAGPVLIQEGLEDYTGFWKTSETDGGFDFALGPADTPSFAFDADASPDRAGPSFAQYVRGNVVKERAPGLVPGHGNPQVMMRLRYDADGYAHVLSGYGGTDSYGVRSPAGFWAYQPYDRLDVATLAVASHGRATVVGTQPHGGTTLEASTSSHRLGSAPPAEPQGSSSQELAAALGPASLAGPLLVLGAVAGLATLGPTAARATVDRLPRVWAPPLAFFAGYSRIRKDSLLEHKARDRIMAAAQAAPGAPVYQIRRGLEMPRTTFFYHLHRLEDGGLLHVQRSGVGLFVSPTAATPNYFPPYAAVEEERRLLELTHSAPGRRSTEYAAMLGWNTRTVHERLARMERRGLVHRERLGPRDVRWHPAAADRTAASAS